MTATLKTILAICLGLIGTAARAQTTPTADGFDPAVIDSLRKLGHDIQTVGPFEEIMGHAGAIVWHPDGLLEGASDPRSDGAVAAR